ncbi:uncharacterized protein LOC107468855 [Arachis duranensis]|uniref:Uncharacterized protein LOC107468855 n=1 Tax=Arachis duranensis TaxID=130453 RepID=A0A9C6WMK8_ARADU|nr:uncharacterized protein LOC107468855 [Arachis duranensis]
MGFGYVDVAAMSCFLPLLLFFSSTVPHFHLRFHHAREKETLKENPSFSSSLLLFSHRRRRVAVAGSPSLPRWVAVAEEQSIHREAVLSPSSSPVAKKDSSGRRSPTRAPSSTPVTKPSPAESNSTMSSSEKLHQPEKMRMSLVWIQIKHAG